MSPVDGRIALVTGGSRGIGRGIACALARAGASVALTYRAQERAAHEVVEQVVRSGGRALAVPMAVEVRASVRDAIADVERRLGSVAILVNNAAIGPERPFEEIGDREWDEVFAVNLRGPFACCQEVLPGMLRRGWGRLINIASVGGQWGGLRRIHYAASKAGLIGLTRSLARLYGAHGITANAVAPGLVRTELTARELDSPEGREKVRSIPMGRIATIEEVAQAVVFLAGDEASYVTGQTINVNGGMYFG